MSSELWDAGAYWEAHEAWEDDWRRAPRGSPERARLGGLIKAAAAAVQAQRGRWRGVASLGAKASAALRAAGEPALADAIAAWAARCVAARAWEAPPAIG